MKMKRSLITPVMLTVIFPIIILVSAAYLAFRSINFIDDKVRWVQHTNHVLFALDEFQLKLDQTQSQMMTFLLSPNENILARYHQLKEETKRAFERLRQLTIDNPGQQGRFKKLSNLLSEKLSILDQGPVIYKKKGIKATLKVLQDPKVERITTEIRQLLHGIVNIEMILLVQRSQEVVASLQMTKTKILMEFIIALLLLGLGNVIIYRSLLVQGRIRAEQEKLDALNSAIIETATDGILTINENGIIQSFNPAAERIFGYTAKEIVGQSIFKLLPESMEKKYREYLQNARQNEEKTFFAGGREQFGVRKDGKLIPLMISTSKIKLNSDHFLISAIVHDLSQHKQNERQLLELSTRLRLATHFAGIGIWEWDMVNNKLLFDDMTRKLTGISSKKFNGIKEEWEKIVHPEDLPEYYKRLHVVLEKKEKEFSIEYRIIKPGDQICFIKSRALIQYEKSGQPIKMVGVSWDISDLKRSEEIQRKAKNLAEKANRAKSDFLANMSHEIRTPLNAIIGLNLLLRNTPLDAKQKDYVGKIQLASSSLLGIINEILDFSKIEAGKLKIEYTKFNLDLVMNNLSQIIYLKAREKGLELLFYMEPQIPPTLIGDPLRVSQILMNLISNAIKFTEYGQIIVSAKIYKKSKKNITLKFSVKDTGIGISEDNQTRLFKSFSQIDTSVSRKYGGTGLGLSISRRLVEMMGGKIWVQSEVGKGSTFFFTVKLGYEEKKDKTFFQPPVELRNMRIMVVDDIKDIRETIKEQLEIFSPDTTTVASAEECILELRNALISGSKYYDLIIMDWKLEGINGLEAAKQIKKDPEIIHKPKIILMSAYIDKETLNTDHLYFEGFITKPFTLSTLFNIILEVFGKEAQKEYSTSGIIAVIPTGFDEIKGARILLVEDNVLNQQVIKELLENEGFFITIAQDGLEAVEKVFESADKEPYDLVFMDLRMPKKDGYEATREIRAHKQFEKLPIIALTADIAAGDIKRQCISAGMNDVLSKPIEPSGLYSMLVKWIKPGNRVAFEAQKTTESKEIEIQKTLQGLSEIDSASGLMRINYNYRLYAKMLLKFKNNYANFIDELKAALNQGEIERFNRMIHTLKGVAGNLGMPGLQQAAQRLESNIRNNRMNNIEDQLQQTEDILKKLLNSLNTFEKHVKDHLKDDELLSSAEPGELLKELKELQKLLTTYDATSVEKIERLIQPLVNAGFDDQAKQLSDFMEKYDFDAASEIVIDIIESIHKKEQ